ncbi:DegT/DnrJ/EryC1/StrS family aminotransferase [Numidum massiliense]|uniref:DegT/DnrJ/EryC1/StrS family aminotransferase n=1 Tax=Numidum massiliense TaxID=1522315 RepID=UPI0006D554AC|nr:DegT/DnrJ/EryC1/StrS family aminotransferase [Numidum massiliense]
MQLAIDGGAPARRKSLPENYPGAVLIGKEEVDLAVQTLFAQSPFRYYGPEVQGAVRKFEETMARDLGVPYALGVSSGTAALIVALKALGIGYGDKVIVPANTFIATAGAVVCANAVPVFADVDDSLNVDPNDLERVVDDEVKAIITVPILGNACDMDPIMAFANARGIYVIEDVAQSCGTMYKGKYAGTIGHVGTFSFQMNKVITAGEGGAVVTQDSHTFDRVVRYHDQGLFRDKERYSIDSPEGANAFIGQNYRMSEISGAVLRAQWAKLNNIVKKMRENCHAVQQALLAEIPQLTYRKIVDQAGDIGSNLGMILPTPGIAARFTEALHAENIQVYTLYGGQPIYMAPQIFRQQTVERDRFPFNYPFKHPVRYTEDMCPRAQDLIPRTVFLPISPLLTAQDLEEIATGIVKVYRGLHNEGAFSV